MILLLREISRRIGLKQRRSKRGKRVAKLLLPTVVGTALLIPIVSDLSSSTGESGTEGDTEAVAASSGDGTSLTSSDGSTTSGSSIVWSEATSGGSATSVSTEATGSGTSTVSGTGVSGATVSNGSFGGFVLAYEEEPVSGTASDTDTSSTSDGSDGETVSGDTWAPEGGSGFDFMPEGVLTRVEEDWELTITAPDTALAAPQIGTVMTPFEEASDFYLAFVLNHRFNPIYRPGGLELQLWYRGEQLGWIAVGDGVFGSANETIKWTQRLELKNSKLRFSVVNGSSVTWGSFGAGESLHLELSTTLPDLNDYHPNVSAMNSGITFASNRVGCLVLKAARGYDGNGTLLVEDKDPVVVFGPEN